MADNGAQLRRTTIFWNHAGSFLESDKTLLPHPAPFPNSHLDLDAQRIDVNGDGLFDLVVCGTQYSPFYVGWFIQILVNRGNHQFVDETSSRIPQGESSGGAEGQAANVPYAMWVRVIDFNQNGTPDISIEFNRSYNGPYPQSLPIIWMNDGFGRFSTFKIADFVEATDQWRLGYMQLIRTLHGYSFITPQFYSGSGGLRVTGLLAARAMDYGIAAFTDEPLVSGASPIKAVHITELRARIAALRTREGLASFSWVDNPLTAGMTARAQHVVDLRQALREVYLVGGRIPPTYSDGNLASGVSIRALHVRELHDAVRAIE
jgi:hypothetical protein